MSRQQPSPLRRSSRPLGTLGEDLVSSWYTERGYEVVARNWRRREGEIDLIVRRGRVFVFCEVKTRTSDAFGAPVEAVTAVKRARVRHLAALWIEDDAPCRPREIRFDVASVMVGTVARATGTDGSHGVILPASGTTSPGAGRLGEVAAHAVVDVIEGAF